MGYIESIGIFKVEKKEILRSERRPFIAVASSRAAVLHTTEGDSVAGAWAALNASHSAPHFITGEGRIVQCRPIGTQGAALKGGAATNGQAQIQVEMVGRSQQKLWLPPDSSLLPTLAVMRWCRDTLGIPLVRPFDWPDDVGDMRGQIWASANNSRRREVTRLKLWPSAGWWFHLEIPGNCVALDTPVLCADFRWREAGDLQPGDALMAFDECSMGEATRNKILKENRRFRRAIVERSEVAIKPCVRVITDQGDIVASLDHPWLAQVRYHRKHTLNSRKSGYRYHWGWLQSHALEHGAEIAFLAAPWRDEQSWDAGWLAGMFDGEGSLSFARDTWSLNIGQRVSGTADRLQEFLERYDFNLKITHRPAREGNRLPFDQIAIKGGRSEIMRVLGQLKPQRFLERDLSALWEGGQVMRSVKRANVLHIEAVGEREVASLQTSTRTFITGGFLSHNTHWDCGALKITEMLSRANE